LPRIALKKLNLNRPTFQGRQIIAGIQRGDDRKRKKNMKLSNITSGLVLGVTLLLATGASAASKGSLKLNEAVSVNGTQLAKGEYEIMWEGTRSQRRTERHPIQEDCGNGASTVGRIETRGSGSGVRDAEGRRR
jgi:hypothetical protein